MPISKTALKTIIRRNCTLLSVNCPALAIVPPDALPGFSVVAALSDDGKSLAVSAERVQSMALPDAWLYISHECRHLWQQSQAPELLTGYAARNVLNITEYNSQPAEVDANAWAAIMCANALGILPLFENYPPEVRALITRRMEAIKQQRIF